MAGTNRLGFFLHVAAPAEADRAVFGAVPTVWLPERLVDGSDQWYDAVSALHAGAALDRRVEHRPELTPARAGR